MIFFSMFFTYDFLTISLRFFMVVTRVTSYKIPEAIGILHGFLDFLLVLVRWHCFYTRVKGQNHNEFDGNLRKRKKS